MASSNDSLDIGKGETTHFLTRQEMCNSLGITERGFTKWGIKPVRKDGCTNLYDVKSVVQARVDRAKGLYVEANNGESVITKAQAELDLTIEKTRKEKFKNDVEEGLYIPLEVLEMLCAGLASKIGAELDSAPLVIKRKYSELPLGVIDDMDGIFRKCMNAISNMHEDVDEILEKYNDDE